MRLTDINLREGFAVEKKISQTQNVNMIDNGYKIYRSVRNDITGLLREDTVWKKKC